MLTLFFFLLMTVSAQAASLEWDPTSDGFLLLEYSTTETGPFTVLKEIPAYPPRFPITEFGYYRLHVPNGGPVSNVARFFTDVDTGWIGPVGELDKRLKVLEAGTAPAPAPEPTVNNITAKQLDADRIEITGLACVKLDTTGSGLKRIVECLH
jgi:hypothetical protein